MANPRDNAGEIKPLEIDSNGEIGTSIGLGGGLTLDSDGDLGINIGGINIDF